MKKFYPEKTSWNSIPCFCDGIKYKSLFALSIDFEINYSWLFWKLKKTNGAPVTISGHTIVLESWLTAHPEYQFGKEEK